MKPLDFDSTHCSIARTADFLGQRWALVIVRDLMNGVRRYEDLRSHLGISRDVLSARLERLIEVGVVERVPYREPGSRTRQEYRLTEAGRELRTILVALVAWGDRHLAGPEGPPMRVVHDGCDEPVDVRLVCESGHDAAGGLRLEPGPGAVAVS